MAVFWVVAPCSLIEVYQHFRGPCCLHHQAIAPMMEAARTSETFVNFYQTTRRYIPEDSHFQSSNSLQDANQNAVCTKPLSCSVMKIVLTLVSFIQGKRFTFRISPSHFDVFINVEYHKTGTRESTKMSLYSGGHFCKHNLEYTRWSKTQPILDTCSICQKINYTEIRKQKQCYIKCWKCPPCSNTKGWPEWFLCHRNGSPDEILSFIWNRRIVKCIPKLILAS
jgi:hypothetical protein